MSWLFRKTPLDFCLWEWETACCPHFLLGSCPSSLSFGEVVAEVSAVVWRAISCLSCMFNKQLGWQPGHLDSRESLKWSSVWLTLNYLQTNGMVWLSEGDDLTLWHLHFWVSFFQASLLHISFFQLLPFFWRKVLLLLVFSIKFTLVPTSYLSLLNGSEW